MEQYIQSVPRPNQGSVHRVGLRTLTAGVVLGLTAAAGVPAQDTAEAGSRPRNEQQLDEVIVRGVRAAQLSARELELATDISTNVVTGDDVGQFADQNVAESLQRVPGLAIDRDAGEGRRVNVRGLGPLFNPVSINGARVGTADLDRDAVVDVLPSDLLGTIVVTKTLTPDMDLDAVGGAVDLRAIDPFERAAGGSFRLEATRSQYAGKTTPKGSGAYVGRIDLEGGGRLGFSLAGSYLDRTLLGDVIRNRDTPVYSRVGADCGATLAPDCFLRSARIENRVDRSERQRLGFAANFDFQPNDSSDFHLRLVGSRYEQDIERYLDRWGFSANSATAIGPRTGSFRNVDLRKQTTFVEQQTDTGVAQLGGQTRAGSWTFDYSLAGSKADFEVPEQLQGRFRIRNVAADVTQTDEIASVFGRAGTATTSNPTNPANYVFDQILLVTEDRSDEILAAKLDLTRAFELGERSASIKLGAKANRRDKVVDREERVGDPSAPGGIPRTNLGALPLVQAETNVPNWTFQPELGAARALFNSARGVLQPDVDNSAGQDFAVKEDVDAAYIMGSIDLTEDFRLFGGVRAEWTTWETNGRELETLEPLVGNDVLTVRDIAGVENTYTDILPSVHFRWVARPGLLVRGALSTALIRPNFDEGAATREISTEEIAGAPGTYERTFEGGNPLLDPLKALQADLSVAWFPSDATYLYAGLFYKRIEDFFVEGQFLGADVGRLGLPVGNGTINGGFDVAEVILNGDRATVRGLEIAFERYFVNLPGWWRGLFVSGNVTLLDSESTVPLLRPGETLPLIDQADRIGNLSLGWENERFTLRLSGNYRSDQIDTLNSNPLLDQILQEFVSYDVNLRWNVTDAWQIYADGINLNARKDATVFRGDANGPIPADEAVNDFGRSYALGLRVKF